jgi:hypothetical protein
VVLRHEAAPAFETGLDAGCASRFAKARPNASKAPPSCAQAPASNARGRTAAVELSAAPLRANTMLLPASRSSTTSTPLAKLRSTRLHAGGEVARRAVEIRDQQAAGVSRSRAVVVEAL